MLIETFVFEKWKNQKKKYFYNLDCKKITNDSTFWKSVTTFLQIRE